MQPILQKIKPWVAGVMLFMLQVGASVTTTLLGLSGPVTYKTFMLATIGGVFSTILLRARQQENKQLKQVIRDQNESNYDYRGEQ